MEESHNFKPGSLVFWEDPAGYPGQDDSKFGVVWKSEEEMMTLADGTEMLPCECRELTEEELDDYLEAVDTVVYPPLAKGQGEENVLFVLDFTTGECNRCILAPDDLKRLEVFDADPDDEEGCDLEDIVQERGFNTGMCQWMLTSNREVRNR